MAQRRLTAHRVAADVLHAHALAELQRVPALRVAVGEAVAAGLQAVGRSIRDEHLGEGTASALRLPKAQGAQIFVAFGRQGNAKASANAAVTASGPSPPPRARIVST